MKRKLSVLVTLLLLLGFTLPAAAATQSIPTFSIVSVVQDKSVTIETQNFPANDSFTVTMGAIGTRGIDGVAVGTTKSGNGGSLNETYTIPASLAGSEQISIRLQSPTSGYFSYNWFWNSTATATPPVSPSPSPTPVTPPSGSTVFPTFAISAVVQGKSVTIKGLNFPANDTFEVLMGQIGTKGIDGIDAGSLNTGQGGSLTDTFNIPASLAGSELIAIRLQSPTSGFFAYNWFWNTTAP